MKNTATHPSQAPGTPFPFGVLAAVDEDPTALPRPEWSPYSLGVYTDAATYEPPAQPQRGVSDDRVLEVKRLIASGKYMDETRLNSAMDKLFAALAERQ